MLSLSTLGELLLAALAPPRCAACDEPIALQRAFCPPCAATLVTATCTPFCFAAFEYGASIARTIARFKYEDRPDLARVLAAMALRTRPAIAAFAPEVVVPVPLHPTRLVERGFNQAVLLARPIGASLGVPLAPRALVRTVATPRQALLTRAARLENVASAFCVVDADTVRGGGFMVVDDLRSIVAKRAPCAAPLLAAGAGAVRACVVASAEIPAVYRE
jgi:predicted amidophosphoribosyltransferase